MDFTLTEDAYDKTKNLRKILCTTNFRVQYTKKKN